MLDGDDLEMLTAVCQANDWILPDTLTIKTGKGEHHYFSWPEGATYGCQSIKHPAFSGYTVFDIRAIGGQVVAPGSVHPDYGTMYEITNDVPLAAPPLWLIAFLDGKAPDLSCLWNFPLPSPAREKFINGLSVSDTTKSLIFDGMEKGGRSEAIMTVLNALAGLRWEDERIFYVFQHYPIGQKWRDDARSNPTWLGKQIEKAREWVRRPGQAAIGLRPDEASPQSAGNRVTRALESAVTLADFRSMKIIPRPFIVDGLLRQGETGMIFAKTGVGKTFFSLCLAMGATRLGPVIGPYSTVGPCGVLYIDGEMSACDMQQRVNNMAVQADESRFHLLSSELLATDNQSIPALDDEWRPAILNWLKEHPDIGLVVLDNLSSLTPGVAEDKRIDWDCINQWLIELRRNGLSVLLVHHAGKGGDQRGTSAREDQLNLTLKLTALEDRKTTAFRVDFQKARSLSGEQKKPFVIELVEDENGKIDLLHKTLSDETNAQIAFLAAEGLTQLEIRDKIGVSQSGVSRRLKKAEADGLLVVRGAGPDKTYSLTDLGRAATIGMDAEAV